MEPTTKLCKDLEEGDFIIIDDELYQVQTVEDVDENQIKVYFEDRDDPLTFEEDDELIIPKIEEEDWEMIRIDENKHAYLRNADYSKELIVLINDELASGADFLADYEDNIITSVTVKNIMWVDDEGETREKSEIIVWKSKEPDWDPMFSIACKDVKEGDYIVLYDGPCQCNKINVEGDSIELFGKVMHQDHEISQKFSAERVIQIPEIERKNLRVLEIGLPFGEQFSVEMNHFDSEDSRDREVHLFNNAELYDKMKSEYDNKRKGYYTVEQIKWYRNNGELEISKEIVGGRVPHRPIWDYDSD